MYSLANLFRPQKSTRLFPLVRLVTSLIPHGLLPLLTSVAVLVGGSLKCLTLGPLPITPPTLVLTPIRLLAAKGALL